MIEVIITGLAAVTVLYGYILYKHPFQNKDKKDWPDAYMIKLIDNAKSEVIYEQLVYAHDKETVETHVFAQYKAFYDDEDYEVVIEHD